MRGSACDVSDLAEGNALQHSLEAVAFGDAGNQDIENRLDAMPEV